jgi:hypothetical protein
VIETTDAYVNAIELSFDRLERQLGVRGLAVDPGDPLHDVEVAETGLEPEVGAGFQVIWSSRVVRELVREKSPSPR